MDIFIEGGILNTENVNENFSLHELLIHKTLIEELRSERDDISQNLNNLFLIDIELKNNNVKINENENKYHKNRNYSDVYSNIDILDINPTSIYMGKRIREVTPRIIHLKVSEKQYSKKEILSLIEVNKIIIDNYLDRILLASISIIKYQLAIIASSRISNISLSKILNKNDQTIPPTISPKTIPLPLQPPYDIYYPLLTAHPTITSLSAIAAIKPQHKNQPNQSEKTLNYIFKSFFFRQNNKRRDMFSPLQLSVVYRRKLNVAEKNNVDRSYCLSHTRAEQLKQSLLYIPQVLK